MREKPLSSSPLTAVNHHNKTMVRTKGCARISRYIPPPSNFDLLVKGPHVKIDPLLAVEGDQLLYSRNRAGNSPLEATCSNADLTMVRAFAERGCSFIRRADY